MERTVDDIKTDLAATRTAINTILTGAQSTTAADGRSIQRAPLAALEARETRLVKELGEAELRQGWGTHGRVRALEVP